MDDGEDKFDLNNLRLPDDMVPVVPASVPRKIRRRRQHFTQFPRSWAERLSGAGGRSWEVAYHLLYLFWKGDGSPIKLANGTMAMDGVPRESKRVALQDLERRGLISVEWRPKKSPIVTKLLE